MVSLTTSTLIPLVTPGGLLGKKDGLDVGEDSALGDGDASQKPVELLIVPDGQLKVTRDDPGLLVVPGSVAGELEDLGSEVLHDGAEVDRGSSTNKLGVVSFAKKTVNPTDGEREAGAFGTGLRLCPDFSTVASS